MSLVTLDISPRDRPLDRRERTFVDDARSRLEDFRAAHPELTTVLVSDPEAFARTLHTLRAGSWLRGPRFCEWGSGLGILSGLAAIQGLEVHGIEILPELVAAARQLFRDSGLAGQFACGSFVPWDLDGGFRVVGTYGATDWRPNEGADPYATFGRQCRDMDLIHAYPWPREGFLYERLFEMAAGDGAILWLYRHGESPRVLRKVADV